MTSVQRYAAVATKVHGMQNKDKQDEKKIKEEKKAIIQEMQPLSGFGKRTFTNLVDEGVQIPQVLNARHLIRIIHDLQQIFGPMPLQDYLAMITNGRDFFIENFDATKENKGFIDTLQKWFGITKNDMATVNSRKAYLKKDAKEDDIVEEEVLPMNEAEDDNAVGKETESTDGAEDKEVVGDENKDIGAGDNMKTTEDNHPMFNEFIQNLMKIRQQGVDISTDDKNKDEVVGSSGSAAVAVKETDNKATGSGRKRKGNDVAVPDKVEDKKKKKTVGGSSVEGKEEVKDKIKEKADPNVQTAWSREDVARAKYDKAFALAKKKKAEAELAEANAMLAEGELAKASQTRTQLEASLGSKCPQRPPDAYAELRKASQTEALAKYKEGLATLAGQIEPAFKLLSGSSPDPDQISLEGKVTAAFSKIWNLGVSETRSKMGELQFKKARYRRDGKDLSAWKLNGQFVALKK
jgi:hypothetical protein